MPHRKKFEYPQFRAFELATDPNMFLRKIEQAKIVCDKCHNFLTFKFSEFFISQRCDCGTRIFYPFDEKIKSFKSTFVSKHEYLRRKDYGRN